MDCLGTTFILYSVEGVDICLKLGEHTFLFNILKFETIWDITFFYMTFSEIFSVKMNIHSKKYNAEIIEIEKCYLIFKTDKRV